MSPWIRKAVSTILDIGANIGVYSLQLSRTTCCQRILAFEPSPSTHEQLVANISLNGLADRIEASRTAISNGVGKAPFCLTSDEAYNSLKDTKRRRVQKIVPVDVTTIDTLAASGQLGMPGLIKIDVEGLEDCVLRGGEQTLRRYLPIVLCEIFSGPGGSSNKSPEETIAFVTRLGYCGFVWNEGVLVPRTPPHDDRAYNYLFIPANEASLSTVHKSGVSNMGPASVAEARPSLSAVTAFPVRSGPPGEGHKKAFPRANKPWSIEVLLTTLDAVRY